MWRQGIISNLFINSEDYHHSHGLVQFSTDFKLDEGTKKWSEKSQIKKNFYTKPSKLRKKQQISDPCIYVESSRLPPVWPSGHLLSEPMHWRLLLSPLTFKLSIKNFYSGKPWSRLRSVGVAQWEVHKEFSARSNSIWLLFSFFSFSVIIFILIWLVLCKYYRELRLEVGQ